LAATIVSAPASPCNRAFGSHQRRNQLDQYFHRSGPARAGVGGVQESAVDCSRLSHHCSPSCAALQHHCPGSCRCKPRLRGIRLRRLREHCRLEWKHMVEHCRQPSTNLRPGVGIQRGQRPPARIHPRTQRLGTVPDHHQSAGSERRQQPSRDEGFRHVRERDLHRRMRRL
jgi:hypothetical protein